MNKKNATEYSDDEFWTLFEGGPELTEPMKVSLESLMQGAIRVAQYEMKAIRGNSLGCNFLIQTTGNQIRYGSFNPEALSAQGGSERAGTLLTKTLRDLMAKRYVFYTDIKPVNPAQKYPDIGVIGCEDGVCTSSIFSKHGFTECNIKPILSTANMVSWFTGLLDTSSKKGLSFFDKKELDAIGEAGVKCMRIAKRDMSSLPNQKSKKTLVNSLIFEGEWRDKKGVFKVSFDDSIYSSEGGMMIAMLLASVLLGGKACSACVVLRAGSSREVKHGFRPTNNEDYVVYSAGETKPMMEGWFSSSPGKNLTMNGRKESQWWHSPEVNDKSFGPTLLSLAFETIRVHKDEDVNIEEHEHALTIAEAKLKSSGFSFEHYPDVVLEESST